MPRESAMTVCFHAIGYNKKGVIGFVTGGTKLTYMEMTEENKAMVEKNGLPYILDKLVKETNREIKRRAKENNKIKEE